MKLFRHIFPAIVLVMSICNAAMAEGYRIVLSGKGVQSGDYVLNGWHWGKKYAIDTVSLSNGKVIFEGNTDLECGEYRITSLCGNFLEKGKCFDLGFIVPQDNSNFRAEFKNTGKELKLIRGNNENRIFAQYWNLLGYGWKKMDNPEEFLARCNELGEKATTVNPHSVAGIIIKMLNDFPSQEKSITPGQLLESFPFDNPAIINTSFGRAKTEQYLELIKYNHNDTIGKQVNTLIERGKNRELQGKLAYTAYNFFYNSKIMGQEGIAVKIAQEWFLNDRLPWPSEEGKFMLRTFVEFNKHSLIGMDAPELNLADTMGNAVSLQSLDAEYTIVYFYTDDCASCKKETPKLVDFVNNYDQGPLAVYAVYADSNAEKWKNYINSQLFIFNPFMNWVNVWDPAFESGFQMLYNVIKTPQMFLLDKEHKIIGRGLDTDALTELLSIRNAQRNKLRSLIEGYFHPIANDSTAISEGIEFFYNYTKNNRELCREFMESIYTTLHRSDEYTLQQGAIELAVKYILGVPELWSSRFLERVKEDVKRFNMNRIGKKAAEIALQRVDGSSILLSDITTKYKVLYFYRPNCGMCSIVTPKMAKLYNDYKGKLDIEFIAVNLGGNFNEWFEYAQNCGADWENVRGISGDSSDIYGAYWLQNIPAIYLLQDNVVVAKDINDIDLENILKYIIQ